MPKSKKAETKRKKMVIQTVYDKILDYIRKHRLVKGNELKKALNLSSKNFHKYIEVLEAADLIEVDYPPVGDVKLKIKEGRVTWLRR
ncbi:MAG: hypothetical protein DRO04_01095 [Candidatus Iainarchaeum archaeon]|uniref:Uncharacterized protein n=1 Tax=Candidatus Iainarchaeum sp. TaxID=3101447 RepID=A0A497JJ45_9ARCH|nr:MAG: hypothetical protein DRO04_01095 [Candidatus Diapherotrites archaeon]